MSGNWAPPGGEPATWLSPAVGRYPGPRGWDALLSQDGTAGASEAAWPAPAQPRPPGRVSAWLASPAAAPVLAVVTAVTMTGWAAGAVVLGAVAATGHAILPATAVEVSGLVLAVADIAAGAGTLARRMLRSAPARPARPPRAVRRAARRAQTASRGRPAPVQAIWRISRRRRRAFASLPRPVVRFLAAAAWSTAGGALWVTFEAVSHGWLWGGLGTTAAGQQLAAVIWMMHLIAWSTMACQRLDRTRAAARTIQPGRHP